MTEHSLAKTVGMVRRLRWVLDLLVLLGLIYVAFAIKNQVQKQAQVVQKPEFTNQVLSLVAPKPDKKQNSAVKNLDLRTHDEAEIWVALDEWFETQGATSGQCKLNGPNPANAPYEIVCVGQVAGKQNDKIQTPNSIGIKPLAILVQLDTTASTTKKAQPKITAKSASTEPDQTRAWFHTQEGKVMFDPKRQNWKP